MKRNTTRGGIGRFLGLLAVIVAVLAVMTVSAAAAEYEVGSTKELLELVGTTSETYTYVEGGEEKSVTGSATTLAANDIIWITNDFELTATSTVKFPAVIVNIQSKQDATVDGTEHYTITRTKGGFPMFTFIATSNFRNLTFDGAGIADTASDGGAISAKDKYVHLRSSTSFKNFQAANGGAIYAGYLTFYDSDGADLSHYTVENCTASVNGGGIYVTKWFTVSKKATLTVSNNHADGNGGGVYVKENATTKAFEIATGLFEKNSAGGDGGAIFFASKSSTQIGFTGAVIRNNTADRGAGIYSSGYLHIGGTTEIYANTAAGNGGGIYLGGGTLTMTGGTIGGAAENANVATNGAGIAIATSGAVSISGGSITYNNVSELVSDHVGGGLYITSSGDSVELSGDLLIAHNNAYNGGGIYSTGTVTVKGSVSISENHTANEGAGIYLAGSSIFTITESAQVSKNTSEGYGAGIKLNTGCVLTLSGNTKVSSNVLTKTTGNQSGVGIYSSAGTVILKDNASVELNKVGNSGKTEYGAGVFIQNEGSLIMLGGSIKNNGFGGSAWSRGGGVYTSETTSTVWILGGEISGNTTAQYGGAIYGSGNWYIFGGEISNNRVGVDLTASPSVNGSALCLENGNLYLFGGKITENKWGGSGKSYTSAIRLSENGSLYLGASVTVDAIPDAVANSGLVTVKGLTVASKNPIEIYNNGTEAYPINLESVNEIEGDLVKGSRVEVEESMMLQLAAGFTPNQATLDAICLRGAHTLYNPEQSDATLVWGDETYQIIQQAGLADEIFFRVTYAFRDKATVAEFTVSGADHTKISSDAGHCFTFKLAPKQLMDEITITYDAEATYTLGAYLTDLKAQDPSTVDIVNALINYCDAAQAYFQYTPNGYYTGEKPAVPELPDDLTTNLTDEVLKNSGFSGARLVADSKIALSFIIKNWTGDEAALKAITVSGNGAVDFGADTKNGDLYVVIPLSAANYADYYTVKVGDAEVTYGVRDYLVRMKKYEKELPLVKALYAYCVAAQAYSPIQG